MSQNKETAAILLSHNNPPGNELYLCKKKKNRLLFQLTNMDAYHVNENTLIQRCTRSLERVARVMNTTSMIPNTLK